MILGGSRWCRSWLFLCALGTLAAGKTDAVSIKINQVLMAGGSIHIRCTVQPAAENRWLEYGIDGYTSSGRQLNGLAGPITTDAFFDRIPCGTEVAYCQVRAQGGQTRQAVMRFTLAGCESR